MPNKQWLRLPVVSAGAEHLVMGYLSLREEIQPFKNENGFELIAKKLGVEKPRKRQA